MSRADRTESAGRLVGTAATVLALLPALALAVWTRATWPEPAEAAEATDVAVDADSGGPALVEVLVTEGGYLLRRSDPARDGWPGPLRPRSRAPLGDGWGFVPRGPGLDHGAALLAVASRLADGHPVRVQLRGDDRVPFYLVVEAGESLAPLGGDVEARALLAGLTVDARP